MAKNQESTTPNLGTISGSVRKSGSILTGRKTVGIELRIAVTGKNYSIAAVSESLVQAMAPFLPAAATTVNGVRSNRLSPNLRGSELPAAAGGRSLTGRENLFFASGTVIGNPPADSALNSQATQSSNGTVWYSMSTQFERSDGRSIWYRVDSQSSPELSRFLPNLSPRIFTRFLPIALDQVRIGFDLFGTRHLGSSLLGAGPVVIGRLNISVLPAGIEILIEEQFARGKIGVPLSGQGIPERLQSWLTESAIVADFVPYCAALIRNGK